MVTVTRPVTKVSATSLEYVRVRIEATDAGVDVDPTPDAVQMAFMSNGSAPGTADWYAASWEADTTITPNVYHARCLVGTGGTVALTADTYTVWVKITDNPEVPRLRAPDPLVVF